MPPLKASYKIDRRAWHQQWGREQDALFGTDPSFSISPAQRIIRLHDSLPEALYAPPFLPDSLLQNFQHIKSQICILQRDLSKKVSRRYAEDDFAIHWTMKLTPKEREDWILEGLVRTCEASPEFEDHMRYCPELTMQRLNVKSGQGFLDLLEKLVLQDIESVPIDIQKVPNPVWEAMNTSSDSQFTFVTKLNDLQRNGFLTYFVWNTLLAFYGEREEYGLVKPGKSSMSQELKEQARQDKRLSQILKKTEKEVKANRADAQRACSACGLPAERAGVKTLLACQKCKSMGRHVFYCSKDCQIKDWKSGRPPHKAICGNITALADHVLGTSAKTDSDKGKSKADDDSNVKSSVGRWGLPKPGYTRSPALLHQLSFLDEHPNLDYVLIRPPPHADHGLRLSNPMGKIFFMLLMERAVNEYAPREVCQMYDMLLPSAERTPGIGKAGLKKQLKKEYGIDIDEWNPIFQKQVDEKLKQEGKTREQSQKEINEMYANLMKDSKA